MTEESKKQQDLKEQYGRQGNEGQYGQGQYTLEGKPDPHGPQGQQIQPKVPETKNKDGQHQDAYNRQNDQEQKNHAEEQTKKQ